MERSSKRGKIPQSDWPLIMARYEAGETLASIARTYDCSPPAISYVVSRSRSRHAADPQLPPSSPPPSSPPPPSPPIVTEAQLIKSVAIEAANGSARVLQPAVAPAHPQSAPRPLTTGSAQPAEPEAQPVLQTASREADLPRPNGGSGAGASERNAALPSPALPNPPPRAPAAAYRAPGPTLPAGAAGGDQRRTLHLSLGQSAPPNGAAHAAEPPPVERSAPGSFAQPAQPPQPLAPNPGSTQGPIAPVQSAVAAGLSETRPVGYQALPRNGDGDAERRRDGGTFIDQQLRERVDGDIAAFLAAFDAALLQDSPESRSALREATDRLLRAGARTRIELERLEARIPLPPRDNGGRGEPAWRHR